MAQRTRNNRGRGSRSRHTCHRAPSPRVLVVAKEECFQRWAHEQLQSAGFEVFMADDGIRASMVAENDPPDLIVVDHVVPSPDVLCLLLIRP
jgi:DNA-binding response OmpR family regulator